VFTHKVRKNTSELFQLRNAMEAVEGQTHQGILFLVFIFYREEEGMQITICLLQVVTSHQCHESRDMRKMHCTIITHLFSWTIHFCVSSS
jgi:hypothetical protein